MLAFFTFGPILSEQQNFNARVEQRTQDIAFKPAYDAEERYAIVSRDGSPMEICVHAGIVASAWVHAKSEGMYQYWKQIEREDCARAGLQR